ncbi:hypothetical protein NQ318_000723 [Aromia moschata]|uniref:Mos1 transposase HTH domain-containing protein n=1 Tax=Aromia moschata TaxID=1265417 RepID=A0AAV8XU88_9CUCU|nr:hypothetical protein NQ318_000723 [Aromia moschata]
MLDKCSDGATIYGNECLCRTQVFEWFKRFKEGRDVEGPEDDPRPGRPSTPKRTKKLKKLKNGAKNSLTPEQKESRMNICADILNNIETNPGLLDTVTPKGTRFETVETVKAKATEVLNQLTEADFQHSFQQWKSRMERCRDHQGEYIECEKVATRYSLIKIMEEIVVEVVIPWAAIFPPSFEN